MKRKISFMLLLLVFVTLVSVPNSLANSDINNDFNAIYGTTGSRLDTCSTCHTGPPSFNAYGTDLSNNAIDFTVIESLDSDGDGFINIDEINNLTFPGNSSDPPVVVVGDSISGMKFNDLNNNSAKDGNEPGLANWTITLTDQNGSTETTATDNDGNYTFTGLTPGNYTVAEVLKTDWIQTFPTNGTYNVTITGNESMTGMDFGNNLTIAIPSVGNLTSVKVATAPVIDGLPEAIWDQATAMTINISGGANTGAHTVTLKSIYTNDSVYFLAKWNDPTESLRRMPWQKQPNGTWEQLRTPNVKEGGEETYYEDKFSQLWNINITDFETGGCFATCHAGENSDVKAYGNMYTANPGEIGDLWHMKIVRTNTTGFVDDQYLDSIRYSNVTADAGRHSDPGLVPYYNNIDANETAPNFTSADQPAPPYWIFDDQKQPFNDIYNASDEIAGIIVRPPTGDRADIGGKTVYEDGNWTLEYGRKLITESQYDVQFSDITKEYLFGTAVFDNAQTRHSYDNGANKLVFAPSTAIIGNGSISGMKFNNLNNDSAKDANEPGLANWTITLTDQNGSTETTATNNDGNYTFSGLIPGNYTVAEVLKTGWIQTFPTNGTYNVTITGNESITGIDFGNNLSMAPSPTNVTVAVRTIEKESLRIGESTTVTVNISSSTNQAFSLQEIIPAGWNLTQISDDADAFKNSTNEWIWFNVTPGVNKTVVYRLTAPGNATIGTYHIDGTVITSSEVVAIVQGDKTITLDITAYYGRLGSDPNVIETADVLTAIDDWVSSRGPAGFELPITTQQLLSLIDEWLRS